MVLSRDLSKARFNQSSYESSQFFPVILRCLSQCVAILTSANKDDKMNHMQRGSSSELTGVSFPLLKVFVISEQLKFKQKYPHLHLFKHGRQREF